MADGFKIAEAYVEIHAKMDSRAVQREIKRGLDDADVDAAGRDAGDKISAGIREKVGAAAKAAGDSIKKEIGDAGDESRRNFERHGDGFIHAAKSVSSSVGKLFADMFDLKSPMLALAAVALAILALPLAATAASMGIIGIFGTMFTAIGASAALFQERVQTRFRILWQDLKDGARDIAGPFEQTWINLADEIQRTFDDLSPTLRTAFRQIQPHIDTFIEGVGKSFRNLEPMIIPLNDAFGVLLDKLGEKLPDLFGQIADTVTEVSRAFEDNPQSVDLFIETIENLVSVLGTLIVEFTKLAAWAKDNEEFLGGLIWAFNQLFHPISNNVDEMRKLRDENGNVVEDFPTVSDAFDMARAAVENLSTEVSGLVKNLDELAKETLENEQAALKFDKSVIKLTDALTGNNKSLDTTTKEGNRNKEALLNMADAANTAKDTYIKNGMEIDEVTRKSREMRNTMIETAVNGFGFSRQEASKLIDKYFAIPEDVKTNVGQPGMDAAQRKAEELKRKVDDIPKSKNTNITATDNASNVINNIRNALVGVATQLALTIATATAQANGSVLSFASGGEHHVAQIAQAGAMRLWAEPETGGEAYIPLAPQKRPRSEMILSEVARRFGLMVARPMADGGVLAYQGSTAGMGGQGTSISSMTVNVNIKGIWDFTDPAKVRAMAGAIAPAIREAIRVDERRYAT